MISRATEPGLRLGFLKLEISLGSLLNAVALVCTFIAWEISKADQTVVTQHDLTSFQTSVAGQLAEFRVDLKTGLADVHQQIEALPDQRAQMEQLVRRVNQAEDRFTADEARLGVVERQAIENRSNLDSLIRSSSVPLPGGRR